MLFGQERPVKRYCPVTRTHLNLSLREAPAHPELVEERGNLDAVERTSANRRCCDDGIATLRSQ